MGHPSSLALVFALADGRRRETGSPQNLVDRYRLIKAPTGAESRTALIGPREVGPLTIGLTLGPTPWTERSDVLVTVPSLEEVFVHLIRRGQSHAESGPTEGTGLVGPDGGRSPWLTWHGALPVDRKGWLVKAGVEGWDGYLIRHAGTVGYSGNLGRNLSLPVRLCGRGGHPHPRRLRKTDLGCLGPGRCEILTKLLPSRSHHR